MENQIKAYQKRIQLIQSENQKLISALGKYKCFIPGGSTYIIPIRIEKCYLLTLNRVG